MKKTTKKNFLFVIIGFIILIIPIGYFVKNSIALEIQRDAVFAFNDNPEDTNVIKESLVKIDKAIWLYRKNYLFYSTKAQFLCKLKKYHEAINTINQIEKFKEDYAEGYESKGFIYDKLNFKDSANNCYQKALQVNEQSMKDYYDDYEKLKSHRVSRAFDILLLKGKEEAKKVLLKLYLDYPNDISVIMFDSTLHKFDRKTFANQIE